MVRQTVRRRAGWLSLLLVMALALPAMGATTQYWAGNLVWGQDKYSSALTTTGGEMYLSGSIFTVINRKVQAGYVLLESRSVGAYSSLTWGAHNNTQHSCSWEYRDYTTGSLYARCKVFYR